MAKTNKMTLTFIFLTFFSLGFNFAFGIQNSDLKQEIKKRDIILEFYTKIYMRELRTRHLKEELKLAEENQTNKVDNVIVTMYHPVPEQTDSTPNITADGTLIEIENASELKYIAVSRDLLVKNGGFLKFGDYVLLQNANEKSGIYQVRDVMNKRFTNRIDILESPHKDVYKFEGASIVKLDIDEYLTGE